MSRVFARVACASFALVLGACSQDQPLTGLNASVQNNQLEISPASLLLAVGERGRAVGTPTDGNGRVVATRSIRWSSDDPSIASVDAQGFVTGVAVGVTEVVGRRGSHESRVRVVVGGIGADGGSVTGGDGAVTVTLPAGAVADATPVPIVSTTDPLSHPGIVAGSVWAVGPSDAELGAAGTIELSADGDVVPEWLPAESMRIARLVGGEWELLDTELIAEVGLARAEGFALMDASAALFSRRRWRAPIFGWGTYAIINPCTPVPLGVSVSAKITANDCLFTVASRRSDYYSFTIPNGSAWEFTTTNTFPGLFGVKEATANPAVGLVFGSRFLGQSMRVIGSGAPLQLFVSGQDGTAFGNYSVQRSVAEPFTCGRAHAVVPGATFTANLTAANACATTIQFTPFPEALGKPLILHGYSVRLLKGVSYTFRLSGLTPQMGIGFTIFLGNSVLRQSVDGSPAVRQFTFQLPAGVTTPSAYVFAEVSSGRFFDGVWQTPGGSYTLEILQNP